MTYNPRHAKPKPSIWSRFVVDTDKHLWPDEHERFVDVSVEDIAAALDTTPALPPTPESTPIFDETRAADPLPYDYDSSAVIDEAERICKGAAS